METIPALGGPGGMQETKSEMGTGASYGISGIPQLQTAAGLSVGEVVAPAEGHQSRAPQEAALSPYWLQLRYTGTAPNRKSTLKQASGVLTGRIIAQPDTSKQARARGERTFAEVESMILHNMLAFPVQGACWIFMEGWTEGGFFFFFKVLYVFLKIG